MSVPYVLVIFATIRFFFFFFNDPATTEIYTLSLHDALPILPCRPGNEQSGIWRSGYHESIGKGRCLSGRCPVGCQTAPRHLGGAARGAQEDTEGEEIPPIQGSLHTGF